MRRRLSRAAKKKPHPKTKLGLPDLDQAKAAVLGSLHSPESQRGYQHSINEFINWYCSEPRLSFNKTVVTRYRIHLESRSLAPGTINVRLAAIRRLAYEAADSGLLSPELAAGIRRVKGARRLGVRLGNWLTAEQARTLWQLPNAETVKGKRDRAILSILLGCGLRRRELAELTLDHLQQREDHWAVVDLIGKAGHMRTVPVPDWVKQIADEWVVAAGVGSGRLFRCVSKSGTVWGEGLTEKVVWHVVKEFAAKLGVPSLRRMTYAGPAPVCVMPQAAKWNKSNFCWVTFRCKQRRSIFGCKQRLRGAVNDRIGIEPAQHHVDG